MSNEWEEYRSKLGASTPAALSTSTTSARAAAGGKDAFSYLDRLKKRLKEKGLVDSEVENYLGYLASSVRDMATIRLKAEEDSSYLWIKVADEQADFIRREAMKLPMVDSLISLADSKEELERWETRKKELTANIKNALSSYSDSIRQISTISPKAVQKGFADYLDFLMSRNNADQVQILNKVQRHLEEYQKNKRVNPEQWKKDFLLK
jgi:hypothetical protein